MAARDSIFGNPLAITRSKMGTARIFSVGDSSYIYITARSKRHADRIAKFFGWYSRYGGPGRDFQELHYSYSQKRLELHCGIDN